MNNPDTHSARILIVDDQQANLDVLQGLLELQGYTRLTTATDPREVMPLVQKFSPDLILLDLMMPHFSGFEVMEQLKTVIPAGTFLPILVLTADLTPEARQRALAGGATDFLSKPLNLAEVSLRIRNLLQTRCMYRQLERQNLQLEEKVRERTTRLEQLNQELSVALEKAEASDRLKTAFLQNISHEVRTPLNGIQGLGALLADPAVPAEEKQKFIPMLQASGNRLLNTITDYIDMSLIMSGNMEAKPVAVNITKELKDLKLKFREQCRAKGLAFNFSEPAATEDISLTTDPDLFRKVISHLLDNAIKFTSHGAITLGYTQEAGSMQFFVKDTGMGISQKMYERVFEPFKQADIAVTRGHEGSGLGLSIVKGIIRLLGSEIRLESEKGIGSMFCFSLPLTCNFKPVAEQGNHNVTSGKPPVFLIADDDEISRFYLEFILEEEASVIHQAANGLEAVEMCRQHPEIALIFMDIKMPVMDGLEATRQIREFNKDVLIIAQSAYVHAGIREEVIEAGCNGYMSKPVEREELQALLEMHLSPLLC